MLSLQSKGLIIDMEGQSACTTYVHVNKCVHVFVCTERSGKVCTWVSTMVISSGSLMCCSFCFLLFCTVCVFNKHIKAIFNRGENKGQQSNPHIMSLASSRFQFWTQFLLSLYELLLGLLLGALQHPGGQRGKATSVALHHSNFGFNSNNDNTIGDLIAWPHVIFPELA